MSSAAGTSSGVRANRIPSAEPWLAGLTTMGNARRRLDRGQRPAAAPSSRNAVSEKAKKSGVGHAGVAQRVLGQRLVGGAHAGRDAASPCRGGRAARAAPAPCRPRRRGPCRAMNATSGAASRRRSTRSAPASIRGDLVAEALERVLHARARAAATPGARGTARPRAPRPGSSRPAGPARQMARTSASGGLAPRRGRGRRRARERAVERRPARRRPCRSAGRPRGCRPRPRRRSSGASTSRPGRP